MSDRGSWLQRKLWRRAAVIAGLCSGAGAGVQLAAVVAIDGPLPTWLVVGAALGSALAGAVVAAFIVERFVARRLRTVSAAVDAADARDLLVRLPVIGDDELAEATGSLNALLARLTRLQVDVIDQSRELARTRHELELEKTLAAKNEELERRLEERRLLFDLLRVGVTATDVDSVLRAVATRVGEALHMRETALLIRERGKRLTIRAVHGFERPHLVLGRSIESGEGVTGDAARKMEPVVIPDVAKAPGYLGFWGESERVGGFAAFPIVHQEQLVGVFAVTRAADLPITDADVRLLTALADQTALAIRHAELIEELQALSTTDELTRLPNRRVLAQRLEHELDRADRFGKPVSVVAVDLDKFHDYNEAFGHAGGDEALRAVADALRDSVRKIDTVARTGGEEFVVVLAETSTEDALGVAEKLRVSVASREVPGGHVTISLGVATRRPDEGSASLLERADLALFAAKRAGRNRVCVAGAPEPAGASAERSATR